MSRRVLYVERSDRGDRLAGLRLVGPRTSDAWRAPEGVRGVEGVLDAVRDGADWVVQRLAASDRATLDAICLDAEGTICSWLSSPSDDPAVLMAVARGQAGGSHDGDHEDGAMLPSARALDHFAAAGAGLAIQALAPATASGPAAAAAKNGKSAEAAPRRRIAVLGVADSAAGLLLDALDERGVALPEVRSIWNAMATAWDPASAPNTRDDGPGVDRLVGDVAPVTAVVVVDPRGRLAWAWSRRGELLTGGSMLLVRARPQADRAERGSGEARVIDPGSCVRLETTHAARLAAEWLSWSAQTGSAPGRVVVLCPERTAGLSPSEFCTRVVSAWPGATVDLVTDDEPIELTLRRPLADEGRGTSAPGGGGAIAALSARPGRSHRSLYIWGAAAVLGLAAAAGVAAVLSWRTAADARARADAVRRDTQAAVLRHYNDPMAAAAGIILTLEDELARLQAEDSPADMSEFKPVLQELETIGLVISSLIASNPGCELRSMQVDNMQAASITVRFPPGDVATFENFRNALTEAGISELVWTPTSLGGGTGSEATFRSTWRRTSPGGMP